MNYSLKLRLQGERCGIKLRVIWLWRVVINLGGFQTMPDNPNERMKPYTRIGGLPLLAALSVVLDP